MSLLVGRFYHFKDVSLKLFSTVSITRMSASSDESIEAEMGFKKSENELNDEDDDSLVVSRTFDANSRQFLSSSDYNCSISTLSTRSGGRLSRISTQEARNKSYLVGSAASSGSLLGAEQLDAHFPNRHLNVFIGTWNTNSLSEPPMNLDEFLLPLCISEVSDVFVVGTQENVMQRSEWETVLQETIGFSHALFHSVVLGTLHLAVFLRRELLWFCSEPEEASIATRQGTAIKTKGAVAIAFQLFGTSFLFVNSHLTAHDHNLKERISDYQKIRRGLEMPKKIAAKTKPNSTDVTDKFDCAFWLGDLNFRLSLDRQEVLNRVQSFDCPFEALVREADQLHHVMIKEEAFFGFAEGPILFPPSYKFDSGSNTYDTSNKRRTPAYTDRILFRMRKKETIECLSYKSVQKVQSSDHKPVYAVFKVKLRPGRDDIPLAAGHFVRSVYVKALERRALLLDPLYHQKLSRFCCLM